MNTFIQSLFLTSSFLWRIFSFDLKLKDKPSKVDIEDHELGLKIIDEMKKQMAKMNLTSHKHTDIWSMLQVFPDIYRSGDQQDVTETVRFIFDKMGSFDQPLVREIFGGELSEQNQCQVCWNVKRKPETFTDLVLTPPQEKEVLGGQVMPTVQALINQRLQFEYLDDDNMLECQICMQKQRHGKWCEIVSPPQHLCLCLSRFSFDMKTYEMAKEFTPIHINEQLNIGGPFTYELYMVIIHTGKTATSGHYYAIGRRSENPADSPNEWMTMDDSQLKPADLSVLTATNEKKREDSPYVLFYRCQQAPPTPPLVVPWQLSEYARQEEAKQSG